MDGPWTRIEVGLVLQGGGALGAYEWGAIDTLFGLMDDVEAQGTPIALKAVTGVSIGAINGACIVGATDRHDGLRRLAALWNDLKLETPFQGRIDLSSFGLPSIAPGRDLSLWGLPGFYVPRPDLWNMLRWTSFYDTRPLEQTLRNHVSFANINASPTTFVVTAVDVEFGLLKRFRNKPLSAARQAKKTAKHQSEEQNEVVSFEPLHIMASGSLAPQFPWTEIKKRLYWDGGIVDNTPLGDAMEAFSDDNQVYRLLIVMNLYPLTARKPANLLDVNDRVHELSYGNRLRQDRAAAKRINKLARTIELLAAKLHNENVPLGRELEDCIDDASQFKIAKIVDIDFQSVPGGEPAAGVNDAEGLRDFTPATVDWRRAKGAERAEADLKPVLEAAGFLPKQPAQQMPAPTES
ncbi:MAG: patatin-like phospholipase family protein [Xanthobacteraceae bacterium]